MVDDMQAADDAIARMDLDQEDIVFGARGRARDGLGWSALALVGAAGAAWLAVGGSGVWQAAGLGAASLAGAAATGLLARALQGVSEARSAQAMRAYLEEFRERKPVAPESFARSLREYEVAYTASRTSRAEARTHAAVSGAFGLATLAAVAGAALGVGGPIGLVILGAGALYSAFRSFEAAQDMRSERAEARASANGERFLRREAELFGRGATPSPAAPKEPAARGAALPDSAAAGRQPDSARTAADGIAGRRRTGSRRVSRTGGSLSWLRGRGSRTQR